METAYGRLPPNGIEHMEENGSLNEAVAHVIPVPSLYSSVPS